MGRRYWWMLAVAWLLTVSPWAGAVHVIPAVDLPDAVPDTVRDRVARELASNRDRLSGVVHPFRGEFHGLGIPSGGASAAFDLSSEGRVVVGSDYNLASGYRGYVWSPATGKVYYNLLPNGSTGQTEATTVSADGVYVAGDIWAPNAQSGFRWSLAGRELISPPDETNLGVVAISGNGGVTVGTASKRRQASTNGDNPSFPGPHPFFLADLRDDGHVYEAEPQFQAYRYARDSGLQELSQLPASGGGYHLNSSAVDVAGDGKTVLVKGYDPIDYSDPGSEPFLWKANGEVVPLGQANIAPIPGFLNRPLCASPINATAISSDGSTVVGQRRGYEFVFLRDVHGAYLPSEYAYAGDQAILWREATGWIDLGDLRVRESTAWSVAEEDRRADDLNGNGSGGCDHWLVCHQWPSGLSSNRDTATAVSGDGNLVLGVSTVEQRLVAIGSFFGQEFFVAENIPFLWDEQRGMRELSDVLRLDYGLSLAGWSLGEATAISDDGTTIIGNGVNPNGDAEAWRAVLDRGTPDGDLDFDGDVDHHDYQTLVGNLGLDAATDAVFYADGDLNADGLVDQTDADALLSRYENRWMGDFNADGLVDLADYTLWRDLEGLFTGGLADSNGDGWVNDADLAAWRSHFGMAVEAIRGRSVPEPTAIAGLLVGLIAAAVPQRRAGAGARGARG